MKCLFFVDFTRFSEHSPLLSMIIIFRHFSSYFGIYVVKNVVLLDVHEIRKNVMVLESGGIDNQLLQWHVYILGLWYIDLNGTASILNLQKNGLC